MTHDDARLLLSAIADGEADRTPDLDAHLAGCADCAGYAADLDRLATLAAALPRPVAPPALAARVTRRIRRRRWSFRLAPALVAATAAAVFATTLTGAPGLGLPPAAAAEPLLDLRSLYVARTVTEGRTVVMERIWWRAPGSLRVERTHVAADGTRSESLVVENPGVRHANGATTTGLPPSNTLPEPLSPTVALAGEDCCPGPVVAGLPTRAYVLEIGGERRVAHVADGVTVGGRERLVLVKMPRPGVDKRASEVRVNPDLPDHLFAVPAAPATDAGFRDRPLGDLAIEPARRPEGLRVVRAGAGPRGEAFLLARGSLLVLVTSGARPGMVGTRDVVHEGVPYTVGIDVYAPPAVEVATPAGRVTVSAPLPPESLVALAVGMYPPE